MEDWTITKIALEIHKTDTQTHAETSFLTPELSEVFLKHDPEKEKALADYLHISPAEIWPTRYYNSRPLPMEDWHRNDIQAEIRKKGSSVAKLSVQNGYAAATLYDVFRQPWFTGEKIIADFLGVQPQKIWPSRYNKSIWALKKRDWLKRKLYMTISM